jgi:hypothetical protein
MNVTMQLVDGKGPLLELSFVNDSARRQHLAAPRVEPAAVDGSYFQFEPPSIPFLGIQVKRGPYRGDELLVLDPGDRLVRVYDLGILYDLSEPVPTRVRYRAMHPVEGIGQPSLVESSWLDLVSLLPSRHECNMDHRDKRELR